MIHTDDTGCRPIIARSRNSGPRPHTCGIARFGDEATSGLALGADGSTCRWMATTGTHLSLLAFGSFRRQNPR
jgi:hypothetical protein